ncbi:60S acidic ribosomal protein P2-2-like [Lolium rigidum]|jgi:large subunit ribosomal protein LP2|uniref:60S acidic ribosomal protein P2-2-like n=1 Tax=Lolium rigidum TaxID=89674 RepID=UPI001F5CE89A|nr:60S acidic ribosomal protein P2-2-like [Lolium rigidum]XP_051196339.1 60S acidic ribosomal protein P2-2-like [Lolium perenne]
MKLVAAYLLANMAGNPSPTKDDVRKILDSVGAEVEEDKLELLFKEVEGKSVAELIAAGKEKFAYAPSGAGAGVDSAPTAAASGGGAAAEKKKEEKAEEKIEEEEDDNMFSLFDD